MYKLQRGDVENLAAAIGERTRSAGNEIQFLHCPKCHGGRKHDEWTFSINRENGAFKCMRASCDYHGWFVQLARDVGYRIEEEDTTPHRYRKPIQPKEGFGLNNKRVVEYLDRRGISRATAERYGCGSWERDGKTLLVMPHWDALHETVVCIKVRDIDWKKGDKGAKEVFAGQDTKPILYGMDQCDRIERDQLVITEGQIDALSLAEAGVKNPVSVPNGANGNTWLKHCKEFVESFKRVVVFGDMDKAGMTLVKTLSDRLKGTEVYAVRRADYLEEKDANAILCEYGPEELVKAVANAEPYKGRNVVDLSEVEPMDPMKIPRTKTNIYALDKAIGGLLQGQIVLITGRRGEGKSTFVSNLIKDAIYQDKRVFAYSGELTEQMFKYWLDCQLAGKERGNEIVNEFGDRVLQIPKTVDEQLRKLYHNRMFLYRDAEDGTEEDCIKVAEECIRDKSIDIVVIDNLMTANHVTNANDLYVAQSNFVGRLKALTKRYNVCVILLAHPRKSSGELDNDDVSGSGDITNRVDVVLTYERANMTEQEKEVLGGYERGLIGIRKNRLFGTRMTGADRISVLYDPVTRRIRGMDRHDVTIDYLPEPTQLSFDAEAIDVPWEDET